MRTIIGLLIFVLILILIFPIAELKNSAQDSKPMETTQESLVNDISQGTLSPEPPLVLATETASPTHTLLPTEVSPVQFIPSSTPTGFVVVIYTPSSTVTPFPPAIVPIEISPANFPSSTVELPQDFATVEGEATIGEATQTAQPSSVSITCALDVDADGIVTDDDLSQLGRSLLNSTVNNSTSIYDLNANSQIDIGDLQKMVVFLFETCAN